MADVMEAINAASSAVKAFASNVEESVESSSEHISSKLTESTNGTIPWSIMVSLQDQEESSSLCCTSPLLDDMERCWCRQCFEKIPELFCSNCNEEFCAPCFSLIHAGTQRQTHDHLRWDEYIKSKESVSHFHHKTPSSPQVRTIFFSAHFHVLSLHWVEYVFSATNHEEETE